jgi:hypothetical protein
MVRAGHSFALSRTIAGWPADEPIDRDEIADRSGLILS